MQARKPFLFRTDPAILSALQRWAADELRSANGQIDYLLRRALRQAGRLPEPPAPEAALPDADPPDRES